MEKKIYTFIICILITFQVNAQCSGNELDGSVTLVPLAKDKLLTYNIYHGFTLIPGSATLPLVKAISYNHALVTETGLSCSSAEFTPALQPAGYDSLKKDTMIGLTVFNEHIPVNYKITTVPKAGTQGTMTDSAFANGCLSKAKASTCIAINPYSAGIPLSGEIQSYGFGQSLNSSLTADAFAISVGDVTAESTKKLRSGTIIWVPWVASTSSGKGHGIRQKAGTSDPITYFVHNYNTGLDTSGTLLTISMTFYTDTDTLTYINKWKNDTVRMESDSAEFYIDFPSTLTNLQGNLLVKVEGGIVTQSIGTGFFSSVPVPIVGTTTPVVFPLQNLLNFNYNLGNFNNDPLQVIINMFGNSINNHMPSSVLLQINDSVNPAKCKGEKSGSVYLNVIGDHPPFTYLWNNGAVARNRLQVKAKTYTVTVTDSQGFTKSKTITVTQPPKLVVNATKSNVKCAGNNTGKITLTTTGGTPPYTFSWNTGATTPEITNLFAGTYMVTVTDGNGCFLIKTMVITENLPLTITAFSLGGDSAMAIATGGLPPYVFKWFTVPQQVTATATGLLGGGVYKVKVTDSKSCTTTIYYTHPFTRLGNLLINDNAVTLQPNPTHGKVTLHFENVLPEPQSIRVYDVTGKVLFMENLKANQADYDLDFTWLQQGVYFVAVSYGDKISRLKLVKH